MAAIDYFGIETSLQTLLTADALLTGVPVYVEEDFLHGLEDNGSAIVIYQERREPHHDQVLAGGKYTRYLIRHSIWVRAMHIESIAKAMQLRDTTLKNLELVLMKDRTIAGKVDSSWLEGGDMMSAKNAQRGNYMASAEVVQICDASTNN